MSHLGVLLCDRAPEFAGGFRAIAGNVAPKLAPLLDGHASDFLKKSGGALDGVAHAASFLPRTTSQATSGRSSSHVTFPLVALSMPGQYSAGTFPRDLQLPTVLGTTPSDAASFAKLPTISIARFSASILHSKHERSSVVNTFVDQAFGLITCVKDKPLDTVAKRLIHARGTQSQATVAKAARVSQTTVGNIEAGIRQGTGGAIAKIADALGVSLKWLRDGEGPMTGQETIEGTETDFAMLEAFQDMSDDDREAMLKEAMDKAERFKRLAQEVISRHTPKETAAADAFKPDFQYDKKNKARRRTVRKKVV